MGGDLPKIIGNWGDERPKKGFPQEFKDSQAADRNLQEQIQKANREAQEALDKDRRANGEDIATGKKKIL
jgi:hypothetical protein